VSMYLLVGAQQGFLSGGISEGYWHMHVGIKVLLSISNMNMVGLYSS
jgi:hypothetical protein